MDNWKCGLCVNATRVKITARHVQPGYIIAVNRRSRIVRQVDENPVEVRITTDGELTLYGNPDRTIIALNVPVPALAAARSLSMPVGTLSAYVADGSIKKDGYGEFYPSEIERFRESMSRLRDPRS